LANSGRHCIETATARLKTELGAELKQAEQHLEQRIREIEDRPVVVHVDMSRVRMLENKVEELAQLEAVRSALSTVLVLQSKDAGLSGNSRYLRVPPSLD
jgi:hypothetical protein